ncbi:MAG: transcription antitermination factor NusB [Ruminococcaceae bacterium]|jgi:N utilization substance protein B|nr:transcription antitermination factor NusB [Oscillospiraceae bacterium]MEE1198202.1 transcription antitermination factor NusB [Acutalibacteraceae bacterium]
MLTRKQAREQAFILIFEKCFRDETVDEILETAVEFREFETDEYTVNTFRGVYENLETIDAKISANSQKWDIARISRVSLAILRLALYEILFIDEIPESVSANEAVELAKKYAAESDASFINGVLGAVIRSEG